MAIGTREQPEKTLDTKLNGKRAKRRSRSWAKQMQNRKERHLAKLDPELPPHPKYRGWEW